VSQGAPEDLIEKLTVGGFIERAASSAPVPGGGGIAALAGAAAASMLEMTLNLTVGRPKFAAVEGEARGLLEEVTKLRRRLTDLVGADAAGYAEVARALKMPRETEDEKAARKKALSDAMRAALEPPLEMVRTIGRLAELAGDVLRVGNPNLAGDAGVAAVILPGAARAAAFNVWANVGALGERESAATVESVRETIARTEAACRAVADQVEGGLCPKARQDRTSA